MPTVPAFHSVNETGKPPAEREHHSNSTCPRAHEIPESERRPGTGKYQVCQDCSTRNAQRA